MSSAPPARVASACAAARAELRAVNLLYSAGCEGPALCSALERARRAVVDLEVVLRGRGAASDGEPDASSLAALDADFASIAAATRFPPPEPRDWPPRSVLHRARLRVEAKFGALREEAAVHLSPERSRRARLVVIVLLSLLAAALLAGVALAMRPRLWRVEYFRTMHLVDPVATDLVLDVGGRWDEDSPHAGVPSDNFSARWQTCMILKRPSEIDFRLESDDGSRLFVDDEALIDQWREQSLTGVTAHARLAAGTHTLRVEYFEKNGAAELALRAQFDGRGGFSSLPRSLLQVPRPGTPPCAP